MSKTEKQQPKRSDPVRRFHDPTASWMKLENKRPDFKYVFSSKSCTSYGPDFYMSIGYEPVLYSKDSPRPAMGKFREGQEIELRGHVLMAAPKTRADEIEEQGIDGISGQAHFDALERKIVARNAHEERDGFRGRGVRPYFTAENETTPLGE